MNMHTAIALPLTVADIIEEHETKSAALPAAITALNDACTALDTAATVVGTYVESNFQKPSLHETSLRKNLLKSGWQAVYDRLQIDLLATAKDKKLFKQTMADPPPLTMATAKATFGDYLIRPRFHVLRGLAEVFCSLDPAYKSHSKVRIGVKGLPKRVIINWGDYGHGYGFDQFRDMVNALAILRGQPRFEWHERQAIDAAAKLGEDAVLDGRTYTIPARYPRERVEVFQTIDRGLTVRKYLNGNAHVIFDKWALFDINKALGEFYGEVLPDVEPENVKPSASTAVSKDLQYYPSPAPVIDAALEFAGIYRRQDYCGERPKLRVLEPSCGDGRILDELAARGYAALGIEYHPGRAAQTRAKGHAVLCANFLDQPGNADFDVVVMNPPFYGKHYVKHVRHALQFLKPGGTLVAILPATARYDHDELNDLVSSRSRAAWHDLPVASFADSGTNVPTVMVKLYKPK